MTECPRSRLHDVGNGSDMRRLTGVAALAALALGLAACTSGGTAVKNTGNGVLGAAHGTAGGGASPSPSPAGPGLTIIPGSGAKGADPGKGITVTASGGTLKNVSVRTSGDPVTGSY